MEVEIDLMGDAEMRDPSLTAAKLFKKPRAFLYEKYDPPFYILSRYDDVTDALLDSETFIEGFGNGPNFQPALGILSDAPHHTFIRKLVQQDFLSKQINELEPRLHEIVHDLLGRVENQPVWDIHEDLSFPLPVIIICEILGIPTDDLGKFKKWADASVANMCSADPLEYARDLDEMRQYLLAQVKIKREDKCSGGVLSTIAQAKHAGAYLSDDECVALATQIFVAGNETTTSLISNLVWRLLTNEGLWDKLCKREIDADDAINESLRFDPPLLGLFKTTSREVIIDNVKIPAGTKVMMHYGAANRDPNVFESPHLFNVKRNGKKQLSFSIGLHVCLGRELAKLEARVALNALREKFPNLTLLGDGERVGPFLFWGRARLPVSHQA